MMNMRKFCKHCKYLKKADADHDKRYPPPHGWGPGYQCTCPIQNEVIRLYIYKNPIGSYVNNVNNTRFKCYRYNELLVLYDLELL